MNKLILCFLLISLLVVFSACRKEDTPRPPRDAVAPKEAVEREPEAGDRKVLNVEGVEFAVRYIPPGTFLMGSPEDEPNRKAEDETQHEVQITKGFWMMETAVIQPLYEAVTGENPSEVKIENLPDETGDLPVTNVSWNDAVAFCEKLSEITGKTWELPTEAEFEYATRAGTTTMFYWGQEEDEEEIVKYEHYGYGAPYLQPVAKLKPNPWGLYDMVGNTWEWVYDWYQPYSKYEDEEQGIIPKRVDPRQSERTPWHSRSNRGTMYGRQRFLEFRSAKRGEATPETTYRAGSFRAVLRD